MERERVVGEPTPDAVVAVIKVDPMYRLASTLGHSAAVAVARRHIDETVSAIDAEVTVVELSTTRFALLIPHGGPGALDALRSRFEAGAILIDTGERPNYVDVRLGVVGAWMLTEAVSWGELVRFGHRGLSRTLKSASRVVVVDDALIAVTDDEAAQMKLLARATPSDFRVHYQPIVSLGDGEVAGYEALLRWYGSGGQLYGPSAFFPFLEETALLRPVTRDSLATAVSALASGAIANHCPKAFVAINLSERQLLDPRCVDAIVDAAAEKGIALDRIWVEVREDEIIRRPSQAGRTIEQLGAVGCTVCIDDLGAGYSALSYIKDLPIAVLKVDIALVCKLLVDPVAVAITRTICDLAQATGLRTVAEGVESPELIPILNTLGFDYAQGYLFGRPAALGSLKG
ncbi:EAL domain-containing protein [Gordonia sp. VNK1]|uniref:EAL domain-containing protein n=1 Tax=Gordonia oleivorans TaxID=3156618 RepID=UPI0032B3FF9B